MRILFAVIVYCVYAAFCWRVVFHALVWYRAAAGIGRGPDGPRGGSSFRVWMETTADVFFFRRLFRDNGLLWLGAWVFHLSFLIVLLRHLRYVMNPVPEYIAGLQSPGLFAGYVLPLAIVVIAIIRTAGRERYVSRFNYLVLGLVFFISVTGLLLHVFRANLVGVKEFVLGILTFSPQPVPHSLLFIVHFVLVLVLALSLPFHLFIAPVIMHEARRRESELRRVLHE